MEKNILITGASSGFGLATARKFAKNGWNIIFCGRREQRIRELEEELKSMSNIKFLGLVLDVRNRNDVESTIASLPRAFSTLDVLINNAGLAAGLDLFDEAELDDWEQMIDTNIKGLLYMSRACLPLLKQSNAPHIINIGSTAAKNIYERGNVYCASKAAVDALSQSMRIDLLKHQIKVTAIHPGAAETEFSTVRFKGDSNKASAVYKGFTPLKAEDIADIIYYCATLPKHVCINDLVVTPTMQANAHYIHKKIVD
ncbi:MAG: SDR family NAD(P)-dependent oxidoreductase [Bacteroidota bacterium]|jgi:3-hydroxy acid dehydrogenase/malonic semialdehyde reductase